MTCMYTGGQVDRSTGRYVDRATGSQLRAFKVIGMLYKAISYYL